MMLVLLLAACGPRHPPPPLGTPVPPESLAMLSAQGVVPIDGPGPIQPGTIVDARGYAQDSPVGPLVAWDGTIAVCSSRERRWPAGAHLRFVHAQGELRYNASPVEDVDGDGLLSPYFVLNACTFTIGAMFRDLSQRQQTAVADFALGPELEIDQVLDGQAVTARGHVAGSVLSDLVVRTERGLLLNCAERQGTFVDGSPVSITGVLRVVPRNGGRWAVHDWRAEEQRGDALLILDDCNVSEVR